MLLGLHLDWNAILVIVVGALGAILRQAIVTPSDSDRAHLITRLADDAAAVVLNLNPKADWAQMVRDVIAKLAANPATATENSHVLESAAIGALSRLGQGSTKP